MFLGFVRTNFEIFGEKKSLRGIAVVDTGSLMTILDRSIAESLNLKSTGRSLELTTLSGEKVFCSEMVTSKLIVEGETLVSERVAVCELPTNTKEKLKAMDVDPYLIIGVITLEAAGLKANPVTGKVEKVGWVSL